MVKAGSDRSVMSEQPTRENAISTLSKLFHLRLAAPEGTGARRYAFAAFTLLFFFSFLAFLSTLLIRGNALTTGYYLDALDETRAFDRVYEDLLADPELTDAIEPLFGSIGVDRSYTVSTLRFVAPPDQLRAWSEEALTRLMAYVRGDVPRYSGEIDFAELFENQRSALVTYVVAQLLDTDVEPVDSQREFEQELNDFVNELTSGRIPTVVPAATIAPGAADRVTNVILRPLNSESADAIRSQVETYVSLNDIVGALTVAVPELLEEEIERANQSLLDWLGGDTTVDPTETFADVVQEGGNVAIQRLDTLRQQANVISPRWLPWVSIIVMAVAMGGLMWLTNGIIRRLVTIGVLFAATGALVFLIALWFGESIADIVTGQPFDAAFEDAPEGWGLPQSARLLIGDIKTALFSELAQTVTVAGGILALIGIAVIAISQLAVHLPVAAVGRYNWVVSKETAPFISLLALGGVVVPLLVLNAPERGPALACNGHTELCDLAYDEVTFAATHNSMATSSGGWLFPSQDVSMRQQLDDGIRAMLIDTRYWQEPSEAVERLVNTESLAPEAMGLLEEFLSGFGSPPPGTFLCHLTCWAGAVQLSDALIEIRLFLEENDEEVLTLIIEDAVSAEDTVDAFTEAGLLPFLFEKELDDEWPTLRQMITSGRRLVVMAEQGSPPPAWYPNAWTVMQETPFDAHSREGLTCAENRGRPENSLFLINHWINRTPPDRVDASVVNGRATIVERANECELARGQKANFVAVNFYRQGDLLGAVDELNGLVVGR